MKIFNITNNTAPAALRELTRHQMVNQSFSIGGQMVTPGNVITLDDVKRGVVSKQIAHLVKFGAISIDKLPKGYTPAAATGSTGPSAPTGATGPTGPSEPAAGATGATAAAAPTEAAAPTGATAAASPSVPAPAAAEAPAPAAAATVPPPSKGAKKA